MTDAALHVPVAARSRASGAAGIGALVLLGAIWLGALFPRIMRFGLGRDEHLYAAAPALPPDWVLYRDVFYNHLPGSVWLFDAVGALPGVDGALMAARLGVFLCWALLVFGGGALLWLLTGSAAMTAAAMASIVAGEAMLSEGGMMGSNTLPSLAFGVVGTLLFMIGGARAPGSPAMVFLAGAALSTALSLKASGVAFVAPAAAAALLCPAAGPLRRRLRRVAAPLAAGGLVAGAPTLAAVLADPATVLSNVLGFHTGPHVAYWAARDGVAEEVALGFGERLRTLVLLAAAGPSAVALQMALLCLLLAVAAGGLAGAAGALLAAPTVVALATLGATLAVALVPAPAFPQYFAAPLATAPLAAAALFATLPEAARRTARPAALAAAAAVLLLAAPRIVPDLPRLLRPDGWTTTATHRAGLEMARILSERGVEGRVATLAPLYPLEGGLAVYPELATGPFAYRVADIADPALRARWRSTSPATVEALLASDPPAALLLGFDAELEAPLRRFAEAHGYAPVPGFAATDRYGAGRLHLRPAP
jgi:hypothetical protein